MKAQKSEKRIHKLNRAIFIFALLFVLLSFTGVYLSSISKIEISYLNLTKALLVVNLIFIMIGNELLKEEKSKYKYSHEYTFIVNRK